MGFKTGSVPGCDRCESPAPDLGLTLGEVDGEQVCHVCRQNEIEETTFLSEREALTLALKDFGMTHQEIADWDGDISKSTVDEYSRRINNKVRKAKRTIETVEEAQ